MVGVHTYFLQAPRDVSGTDCSACNLNAGISDRRKYLPQYQHQHLHLLQRQHQLDPQHQHPHQQQHCICVIACCGPDGAPNHLVIRPHVEDLVAYLFHKFSLLVPAGFWFDCRHTKMSHMVWTKAELPERCRFRPLETVNLENTPCSSSELPIEANRARIQQACRTSSVVVVQASPGSGKTLKLPRILLDECMSGDCSISKYPILVVQPTNRAAMQLKNLLIREGWEEGMLDLQLTDEEEPASDVELHLVSITTPSILEDWISRLNYGMSSPLLYYR